MFTTPWFRIATIDPGAEPSGTTDPYYVLIRPHGVIGLILDVDGRAVLINQYRPPLGRATLEMPAGTIEAGETPEITMERELLEETGYTCNTLLRIAPVRLMLNREDVIEYFFVGIGARPAEGYVKTEHGALRLMERRELLDLVVSAQFEQTVALGGIYMTEKIYGVNLLEDPLALIEKRLLAT